MTLRIEAMNMRRQIIRPPWLRANRKVAVLRSARKKGSANGVSLSARKPEAVNPKRCRLSRLSAAKRRTSANFHFAKNLLRAV